MQTNKLRPGSLDVPQKPSPTTPRTALKLKAPASDLDSLSSPNPISKTPKDRSPKVVDRRSPRSPAMEKKRPSRVPELEFQLANLQDELKKAKDQLISSKKRAQQDAEDAKKQLAAMSVQLEETQKQLKELSDSEEARFQELRKISHDRDREWESELEAVQKQHSMESSALASALNEIQRLKNHLDRISEAEASQARHAESAHAEIRSLRVELTETIDMVEKLKSQLNDSRESEARAFEEVAKAQMLLEVVRTTEVTLKTENANAVESYNSLQLELEESKSRVSQLEELVGNLQADLANSSKASDRESDQSEMLKIEFDDLKNEANRLRDELEAAERRYQDQYLQSTLQIREAYEMAKHAKLESSHREAEWEAKLEESRAEIEELKKKLAEKENLLLNQQNRPEERESELETELKKSESLLENLKTSLSDKEKQLKIVAEENEKLKSEIEKQETERSRARDEAQDAEREAVMKLGQLTEEADKSFRKAARVTEQLDAAQNTNSEMETELRRLKVQSDQWRKAAEAAAAMLASSGNNNGKYVERTASLDYHAIGGKVGAPHAEDTDDDSPKKKNGNVLRKIGVLLKKGQK